MVQKLLALLMCMASVTHAQVTTDPVFPIADQSVTITVDVAGTGLADYADDVWIWSWIESSTGDVDAPTNVNPATDNQSAALMTRSGENANVYYITFIPTDFFDQPADKFEQIGLLLKGADWDDGKTADYSFDVLTDQFKVSFTSPSTFPILVDAGETIQITAAASENVTFSLKVDNVEVATASAATEINYTETAAASGIHTVSVTANNGTEDAIESFTYTVRSVTVSEARPIGIVDGINYDPDLSKVTLSLLAPLKSTVYAVGDFNDWAIDPAYQMKKDGEYFWLEITGLTAGQEYAYQYLVDESIWIADPYTDKILDPDDQWISDTTYPNLKAIPAGALHSQWYQNKAAVLQTNQTEFTWQNTSFSKPAKEELIIYELLVRDFLGEQKMNYRALIDTLDYIEDLGVNAIELMPIMEFNGNDSWGYNPTFMFAVDKAYGTKNDLKEFIDAAHGRGIVVILDMVMNQNDIPSPYAQMYFDFDNFKPTEENPWFNVDAKHPFNVFSDINHESTYTKTWLDSINHYWINEFHFDGYRFDLSKGFTQTNSGDNVSQWGQKDDSRIAILTRMADKIWSHSPDAYVILEHFADNTEEKVLADYGMMIWGNSSHDYGDAMMGFGENKSINWAHYSARGWTNNYLIAYMESHDEERLLFKMKEFGNSSSSHDVKNANTALQRMNLGAAFFFTVPGPKMFWQWGEYGYDISIDENGRTGRKPTHWEYLTDPHAMNVLETYKELIGLRNKYDVFTQGDFTWQPDGHFKSIHLSNTDTSVVVIGNFDVQSAFISPEFQHTGTWYNFFSGEELEITDVNVSLEVEPGEFHIYTDVKLHTPDVSVITDVRLVPNQLGSVYPNPTQGLLHLPKELSDQMTSWKIIDLSGKMVLQGSNQNKQLTSVEVQQLKPGIYNLIVNTNQATAQYRFIRGIH